MSSISKNKSLKAALALGGGLVTVGLMAAMMNDDDGPPEDVVDGVQSTMTGLVDKAGGAVAAMAASVGDAVKASLGGVLKSSAPPAAKKAKKKKTAKTKAASKAKKARKAAKAAKAVAAPVTPPKAPRAAPTQEEPVVAAAQPAPEAAPPAEAPTTAPPAFAVGARVEARWAGTWYGAVVDSTHGDGSYELEWLDDPNVFNTVAAADVRAAAADEPAPPPPPEAEEEAAAAPEEEAPEAAAAAAAEQPADDESCEEAADVQGLLDGAAQRVIVDMLLANASLKIAFDQENPKRPDSASFKRYEAYKAATCGADVLAWGGSKSDVLHDYRKGFLRVTRCPVMVAYDLDRDADVGLS